MPRREPDAMRRKTFVEGLLPPKCAESGALPDGGSVKAHISSPTRSQ